VTEELWVVGTMLLLLMVFRIIWLDPVYIIDDSEEGARQYEAMLARARSSRLLKKVPIIGGWLKACEWLGMHIGKRLGMLLGSTKLYRLLRRAPARGLGSRWAAR
jgi:hypothetical protein